MMTPACAGSRTCRAGGEAGAPARGNECACKWTEGVRPPCTSLTWYAGTGLRTHQCVGAHPVAPVPSLQRAGSSAPASASSCTTAACSGTNKATICSSRLSHTQHIDSLWAPCLAVGEVKLPGRDDRNPGTTFCSAAGLP